MKERIVTSVVLIGILLIVGLIDNKYLTSFLISIISLIGISEAKRLFGLKEDNVIYFLGFLSFVAIFINSVFVATVGILSIAGYVAFYRKEIDLLSVAFYPFLSLMILMDLYLKTSMEMIGWLIVIVAATDSFAYLIGKNFAKKFIPQGFSPTSPNKSWEGVIGGVFLGTLLGSFVGLAFFDFINSFVISFFVSIASVFGDLFESYLKRRAGVKDSGNILP
ncbi:phosphatidate cytidylyltransferase, partial [Caminibacter sp.]